MDKIIKLSNGIEMPVLGYGVFQVSPDECERCVSDVKKAFPKATVTGAFSIYGHEVRTGRAKVEKWLESIVN